MQGLIPRRARQSEKRILPALISKQSRHHAVVVHVYVERRGELGETRHIHDVSRKGDYEARAAVELHITDREDIAVGGAQQVLVMAD